MRFKSFKIGNTGKKSEEETGQEETVTSTEVADMEEKINNKTKKLMDAEKQLKGLTDSTKSSEEDEDEIPGPHGPLIELTLEPGDELMDLDTEAELNTFMDTDEKGEEQVINVVEAGNKDTDKSTDKVGDKVADKAEKKDESEQAEKTKPDITPQDNSNDFNNLFSDEEEEVNPLSNLINSLPEVSAQELINELEDIKEIIRERQQG